MQNYIINVFGAMTTGKSTLVENLQKHIDRIYTVDYDVVKRQIAGFYSKRDRAIATQLTYDTLRAVAKTELSIIALLPPPENEATYKQVEELGRRVINIELVAPWTFSLSAINNGFRP
jgi:dephospho-CoA kinase